MFECMLILFWAMPLLVPFVTFLISLVLFVKERRWKIRQDVRFSPRVLKLYKIIMIVSGIATGVIIAVIVGFAMIMATALAYM